MADVRPVPSMLPFNAPSLQCSFDALASAELLKNGRRFATLSKVSVPSGHKSSFHDRIVGLAESLSRET
jgi:hypothetical protein